MTMWDHQHNLVYNKNIKKIEETKDFEIAEAIKGDIFKDKNSGKLIPVETDQEIDFIILMDNYKYISTYEKVL